jgi:hypothetical protein
MTGDEVLQVLVDVWRQREEIDADPDFDVPIHRGANLEKAANAIGVPPLADRWYDIAHVLQHLFRVQFEVEEWRQLLDPPEAKTLGPVCDVIAARALAPLVERHVGRVELDGPAAVYRTMLRILDDTAVDTTGFAPEMPLDVLLPRHEGIVVYTLSRINPGRLPALRRTNWTRLGGVSILALGGLILVLGATALPVPIMEFMGASFLLAGIALLALGGRFPATCRLGDLHTLRDLAYTLASPPPPTADVDDTLPRWGAKAHPHTSPLRDG